MSEEREPTPSPEIPERRRSCLTLEEVKTALEEAFEDEHERLWANEAWAALIKLGLADYSNVSVWPTHLCGEPHSLRHSSFITAFT